MAHKVFCSKKSNRKNTDNDDMYFYDKMNKHYKTAKKNYTYYNSDAELENLNYIGNFKF